MFFDYIGLDKDGNEVSGSVDAENRTNAISIIQNKGYTVSQLTEQGSQSGLNVRLFESIKTKDLVIFSKQAATLFKAQIEALKVFNLVAENIKAPYFKNILRDVAKSIESGSTIESALNKHKDDFGDFYIAVVGVGESSGTISRSFEYLADYTEKASKLTSKVRKALTYPAFVIIVFFLVLIALFTTVIPQISTILLQGGGDLPVVTEIVISMSDFVRSNWLLLLLSLAGLITGFILYIRTEDGRKSFDRVLVNAPVIGKLFREFYIVRLTSNLAVMYESGVEVIESINILGRVLTNNEFKVAIENIESDIKKGVNLSTAIENQSHLIDDQVAKIIRIGEEVGESVSMFKVITDFYEQKLQDTIDTVIDLIQPLVIVFLGLTVGFLIGAVILPIYSVTSSF